MGSSIKKFFGGGSSSRDRQKKAERAAKKEREKQASIYAAQQEKFRIETQERQDVEAARIADQLTAETAAGLEGKTRRAKISGRQKRRGRFGLGTSESSKKQLFGE